MNWWMAGAIAGFVATAPMTLAMKAIHGALPRSQTWDEPVSPQVIASRASGQPRSETSAMVLHFGFGAAAGALYPVTRAVMPGPGWMRGVAHGKAVWAASYLGWLPAFRVHRSAAHDSAGRNAELLIAHVLWGAVLGLVADRLTGKSGS